ncbi:MAG: molybdenum cofactor biosynthesis protein MoaE [Rhodospirillaceae bacterium]|nr:molybdenum cofactor biosynthesis protein MoaE [Rhodospirillaceae bacterium]
MIRVQAEDFDVGIELSKMTDENFGIGAQSCFIVLVRDMANEEHISAMTLEHYPGMTEKQLRKIEKEANQRWPLNDVLIIHRFGKLQPGDRIVLVATTSAHRTAAIESCHFLIDWLKTKAPFWKIESSLSGDSWVEAQENDERESNKWETENT